MCTYLNISPATTDSPNKHVPFLETAETDPGASSFPALGSVALAPRGRSGPAGLSSLGLARGLGASLVYSPRENSLEARKKDMWQ